MNERELIDKLLSSKNYRDVCPETVERTVRDCLKRYPKAKDADKAAREHLHGITSAFMTDNEAKRAFTMAGGIMEDEEVLKTVLGQHVSTRERLPLEDADALYAKLFPSAPRSVLDLACGLNPLYLAARYPECRVLGLDISGSCVRVINEGLNRVNVRAKCADLLDTAVLPDEEFEYALIFKLLPLLDRQEKGAADRLLAAVPAKTLIVSFPLKTIGGKKVGMQAHYSQWMEEHIPGNRVITETVTDKDRELYYILRRT